MDYYEEYMQWLMDEYPERVHNGDWLIRLFEGAIGFDRFLEEHEHLSKA